MQIEENGGYTWYKIGENMWIAHSSQWSTVYDAKLIQENIVKEPEINFEETKEDNIVDKKQSNGIYENVIYGIKDVAKGIINTTLNKIKNFFKNYFLKK